MTLEQITRKIRREMVMFEQREMTANSHNWFFGLDDADTPPIVWSDGIGPEEMDINEYDNCPWLGWVYQLYGCYLLLNIYPEATIGIICKKLDDAIRIADEEKAAVYTGYENLKYEYAD